ncbi:hypothetical protein ACWD6I_23515 [Streptomyces sp. NPDC002454]
MSPDDETYGAPGTGGSGQTRTRLPDRGDGPRRPGRSSARSTVAVVGIVVLLLAAIAFANRGGDEAPSGRPEADRPDTAPTAATGTRPVDGKNHGIATGHARDAQGAQSAAANFAVALGSAEMFDKERRSQVLRTIFVPSTVARFEAELTKAYSPTFHQAVGLNDDGTAPEGYTFVSRTTPIGTKATDTGNDRATVEVWCSGLLGLAGENSTRPVVNSWFTITLDLEWTDGDWKIAAHSQREGPTPVPGDNRASTAEDMAEAVEGYGGFTYAR